MFDRRVGFGLCVCGLVLASAGPAFAGDKGDCHKARRLNTTAGWAGYVLEHPDGKCVDEATGQMLVLAVGHMMIQLSGGDPVTVALAMSQLQSHGDELASALGGLGGMSGMSGIGTLGRGDGGDLSSLLGSLSAGDGGGYGEGGVLGLLGDASGDFSGAYGGAAPTIYVSFYVDEVKGPWNNDEFWTVLDGARDPIVSCWSGLGFTSPVSMYYIVGFDLKDGVPTVTSMAQDYTADGAAHPDVEACIRTAVESTRFSESYSGSYSYRVELY